MFILLVPKNRARLSRAGGSCGRIEGSWKFKGSVKVSNIELWAHQPYLLERQATDFTLQLAASTSAEKGYRFETGKNSSTCMKILSDFTSQSILYIKNHDRF